MAGTGGAPDQSLNGSKSTAVGGSARPGWTGGGAITTAPAATVTDALTLNTTIPAATQGIPNLGFPTATADTATTNTTPATTGFTHHTIPTITAGIPTIVDEPPPPPPTTITTTPTEPEPPPPEPPKPEEPDPNDWLYVDLPYTFNLAAGADPRAFGGVPGSEWMDYSDRQYVYGSYAPESYGRVGPKTSYKPGDIITEADMDKYNRIQRRDYDRYMKKYGVGYNKAAYDLEQRTREADDYIRKISPSQTTGGG